MILTFKKNSNKFSLFLLQVRNSITNAVWSQHFKSIQKFFQESSTSLFLLSSSCFQANPRLTSDLRNLFFFFSMLVFLRCINEHFFIAIIIWLFPPLVHFSVMSIFSFVSLRTNKKTFPSQNCTHSFHVETAAQMWWANDGKWCLKTFPFTTINLGHEYRWTIFNTACSFCNATNLLREIFSSLLPPLPLYESCFLFANMFFGKKNMRNK